MPEPTPEQQEAQEKMRQWMEQHNPAVPLPGPFGGFGQLLITVQNLVASAGAGEFAIAPYVGDAINKQLTEVQKHAGELKQAASQAATDPKLGGGYAEQVGEFVRDVAGGASGSAEEVLTKFQQELEQLKEAVAKSIGNYHAMDKSSATTVTNAGGHR